MYFLSIVLVIHSFANSKVHMEFLVSLFYRCAFIFLLIRLLFHILQPTKVLAMVLVPLVERNVVNFDHLRRVISSSFATSQGSLVSLVCQRSNFVLPLPLPFLSGAILDLGTRSSCSGGVL